MAEKAVGQWWAASSKNMGDSASRTNPSAGLSLSMPTRCLTKYLE